MAMTNRIHEFVGNIMGRDNMLEAIKGERPVKRSDVIKSLIGLGETGLLLWVAFNATGCAPAPVADPGEPTRETPTLSSPEKSSTPTIVGTEFPYIEPAGTTRPDLQVFNFADILADSGDPIQALGIKQSLAALSDQIVELRGKSAELNYYSAQQNKDNKVVEGVNLVTNPETGKSYVLTRSTGIDAQGKLIMGPVFAPLNSTLIVGEQGTIKGARFDYEINGVTRNLFTMHDETIFFIDDEEKEVLIPGSSFRVESNNTHQLEASLGGSKVFASAPYAVDIFNTLLPDSEINYGTGEIIDPSGIVIFTRGENVEWKRAPITFLDANKNIIMDVDGKPFSCEEFDTFQEGLNYVSEQAKWSTGDYNARTLALNNAWAKNDKKAVEFANVLHQIPDWTAVWASTHPEKTKNFIVLTMSKVGDKSLFLFKNKDGAYQGACVRQKPSTFDHTSILPTPTPTQ